jgi:hypothetical protein
MNSVTPYPWFFVTEVGESEACPVVLREEFVTFSKSASALRGVVFLVRKRSVRRKVRFADGRCTTRFDQFSILC